LKGFRVTVKRWRTWTKDLHEGVVIPASGMPNSGAAYTTKINRENGMGGNYRHEHDENVQVPERVIPPKNATSPSFINDSP